MEKDSKIKISEGAVLPIFFYTIISDVHIFVTKMCNEKQVSFVYIGEGKKGRLLWLKQK